MAGIAHFGDALAGEGELPAGLSALGQPMFSKARTQRTAQHPKDAVRRNAKVAQKCFSEKKAASAARKNGRTNAKDRSTIDTGATAPRRIQRSPSLPNRSASSSPAGKPADQARRMGTLDGEKELTLQG